MPAFAYAQNSVVPAPVQYTVAPETPGPNTSVTISIEGVGTFLGNATITWRQNGKVVAQGAGVRTYTFTTGALGTKTTIHVDIVSSQGTFSQDFSFTPSVIDLVWEADTSVPPMYAGKSLYSAGSPLKVVAYPTIVVNGARLSPSVLSYQWSFNNNPVPDQSGLGDQTFSFVGDQLQSQEDVSVDVSYGPNAVGHGEVVIPVTNPELVLYDNDPLRGILWDEALPSNISLTGSQLTVQAVPYYFSNKSQSLTYAWTLNGNTITGPNSAQGQLTLRQTGSGLGAAALEVSLQNNDSDKLLQQATAALQILFGQTTSSSGSLFGL